MATGFVVGAAAGCRTQGRSRRCSVAMAARVEAASWDAVRRAVEERCKEVGVARDELFADSAPNGPLRPPLVREDAVRLFGRGMDDVRVTLFRDPAYWCPYCQRVQLQLEWKQVPYRVRTVNMRCYGDKPSYYRRMVPSGAIPAVMFDERELMTESLDIMVAIEKRFPESRPLIPGEGSPDRERFMRLMQLERRLFSGWFQYMFSGGGAMGGLFGGRGPEAFLDALGEWDAAVSEVPGPFLLGEEVCLVDALAVPFVERMCATALYWKAIDVRARFRGIDAWLLALEQTEYAALKADYYSTVHDIPPQCGPASFIEGSEPFQKSVDGQDGSWDLPLPDLAPNHPEATPAAAGEQEEEDRLEAATAVLRGADKLVPFALRAVGQRPRTVGAPLADPNAVPGTQARESLELALQAVALAIVNGTTDPAVAEAARAIPAQDHEAVASSLAYLRDRVGVPRDMRFGAARQLRAHLNWFNGAMMGEREWAALRPRLDVAPA